MKIAIVAVGKIKQAGLRAEIDDYVGRIQRYAACSEIELKDGGESEVIARFEKAIPAKSKRIALEVEGRVLSSHKLAELVANAEQTAVQTLAFLIGGSYGLPSAIAKSADLQLSLSAMTLPHRLARLVLAEQVYRAFTILRNEPYSH
ncbi:MAG TPA: 23S rRNA (pseudouridine(1915)-N(3))-methyltransferase RlmH [Polyangiales bacterium]|nr:23S rRNA (pseudouridine(1915)-N(3))-methyltransferase RlmH [Polyangiales bacterium]